MMAKRKHDDDSAGTSADVAPKRKKKNRPAAQVKEQEVKKLPAMMAIPKQEPGEAQFSSDYEKMKTKEVPVTVDDQVKKKKKNKMEEVLVAVDALQVVEDDQKKKKKNNKMEEVPVAVDALQVIEDDQGKKKKKKNKMEEVPVAVDALQVIEDDQGKKKKKKNKMEKFPVAVDTLQVVEDDQKKKEGNKMEEVPVTADALRVIEDDQGKKKKKNKTKEVPVTQAVEDDQGKKKKKNKMEEVAVTVDNALQVVEDDQRKKKNKMEEVPVTADALQVIEDDQGKEKKKNKMKEVPVTQVAEDDQGTKKKKKKNKMEEVPVTVDALQVVEDGQGKKKKKNKMKEVPVTQVVEGDQGMKKKENKMEEVPVTVDNALQVVEDDQGKKKKKKKEVAPTPVTEDGQGKKKKKTKKVMLTPDASHIVEDGQGKEKEVPQTVVDGQGKKTKKRKVTSQDPSSYGTGSVKQEVVTLEVPETVADGQGKKKKRKVITSQDPSHGTGSVKKTILKSQSNGAELDRKKKKKQVTFQLPDRVEDELLENRLEELPGEGEIDFLEELTWKEDRLRPGLVYGMYTPEEDGLLKKAIFDYIREQGWDREEGLEKILNSKKSGARGCWHVIRKCLPQRELKRIHSRAHRILGPNTLLGKWSDEESQSLMTLQALHGNDWKRIATIVGRDPEACKDKWRQLKWTKSQDYKKGTWSEEEHQKLCMLVLKCLHVKAQMKKKGLYTQTHRKLREDISWEFIAGQMGGRSRLDCMQQWYRRMASPMVTTGEWSSFDDQRLLERLMEEFPLSEELVEWDSLLQHRSGETCKKRWEQMQRTLGRAPEVRHQHFLEKLESVMKRFAPHLLDPEYDQKFADDMQRADDQEEDEDVHEQPADDNVDV